MALTYDNRNSGTLTPDNRSNAGSLSLDSKIATTQFLWSSLTLPWEVSFQPWIDLTGLTLTLDIRN